MRRGGRRVCRRAPRGARARAAVRSLGGRLVDPGAAAAEVTAAAAPPPVVVPRLALEDALAEMRRTGRPPAAVGGGPGVPFVPSTAVGDWRAALNAAAASVGARATRVVLAALASAPRGVPPPAVPLAARRPRRAAAARRHFARVGGARGGGRLRRRVAGNKGRRARAAQRGGGGAARGGRARARALLARSAAVPAGAPAPALRERARAAVLARRERARAAVLARRERALLHEMATAPAHAATLFWAYVAEARAGRWPTPAAAALLTRPAPPGEPPLPASAPTAQYPAGFDAWLLWREAARR